jgi:hypothetical protein
METLSNVSGIVSLFDIDPSGRWSKLSESPNQIQWGWGEIACHLFGDGNKDYRISAMYIEFENTALVPSTPSYERSEGVEYYENLALSATKDYLRVPLIAAPAKGLASGYSNLNFNQLTFLAQTAGTQGVHGKTFSDRSTARCTAWLWWPLPSGATGLRTSSSPESTTPRLTRS